MNRQAQAVVLLLFGGAILKASLSDLYLRYVKEGLRPFLLVAGAVLVVTAVATLWYELRPSDDPPDHHHHEPRVGWLLILPVLGLLLVAPPALGSFTAGQSGTVPVTDSDYSELPTEDPAPIGLLDYASRALYDDGRSLAGRRVQLTGFVAAGEDGAPMLARIVVSCCAADGRPIKVGLSGGPVLDVPAGTWVRVTGTHSPKRGTDPVNQADIAYLEVTGWQPITPPKRPYE
ncbi:TIGR03943 family putative permease subunit [Actinoplanes sp. GCM10030250]|uniref:TIGR03943 family putative permease subunit n=1 Tax=Actinoplanes sp. GCM10030250 TaxID=3273376 RepID=UPI00361B0468